MPGVRYLVACHQIHAYGMRSGKMDRSALQGFFTAVRARFGLEWAKDPRDETAIEVHANSSSNCACSAPYWQIGA
ncbi:hypothetical protein N7532_001481 [Penicillium argentinense]|uniref:Uncharacterized protein n=1 Tax=Penicillium argentinense TaxID=1131581 RepID=A0A9W9G2T3_9EURO|nr:uncharacterized protein N7532_001481 [Penicillium argentinense]KAJ5110946.1 hypothetical protein N7532_001481 [Penicillium argentinense]